MFRGLKVDGAEYIGTRDATGKYNFVTGNLVLNIDRDVQSVTSRLSAQDAERAAQAPYTQKANAATTVTRKGIHPLGAPTLLIYQRDDGRAVLAWRVEFSVDGQPGHLPEQPVTFIDAQTGKTIFGYNNLHTVEQQGRGPGGNQRMGQIEHGNSVAGIDGFTTVDKNGTTCSMSNTKTRVMNSRNTTNETITTPQTFSCPDATNRFVEGTVNGAFGVLNDILYNGARTVDMYQTWFNQFPLKCNNVLNQFGHFDQNLENAFWQNCRMHYGDGATMFHPLVSMDVVGHEVSHGVTEGRSGLQFTGQSGGLNESFSDMAGMSLEFFETGANTWKIGSRIVKGAGQLRCMDNPRCDGQSIDNANQFTNGLDPHFASGVTNKAFFLLSTTPGWDTHKAFQVYFRANDMFWTSTTNYQQAGDGACRAAADLGFNGDDVRASLNAVGINPTSCVGTGGGGGNGNDTAVQNGVPVTGINLATGQQQFFKIDVPAGATNLRFVTSGGTGDVDVYAKFGSHPTTTVNDCKSEGPTTAESCVIAAPQAGTYFVLLNGFATVNGVTLTASFTAGGGGGGGGGETVLQNGTPVSGINLATGQQLFFKLDVPAGATNLHFRTTGGPGDTDVYAKLGSHPTTTDNNCASEGPTTTEDCAIAAPQAGTYFVLLNGFAASNGVTLTGSFTAPGGGGGGGGGDGTETVLQNTNPVSGVNLAAGEQRFFRIDVPAGQGLLRFDSFGGTGDTDFYVQIGAHPTTTNNICKSESPSTTDSCVFTSPAAGTYFVLLKGTAASGGVFLQGAFGQ
jgi:pseudolysin/vibriolysin